MDLGSLSADQNLANVRADREEEALHRAQAFEEPFLKEESRSYVDGEEGESQGEGQDSREDSDEDSSSSTSGEHDNIDDRFRAFAMAHDAESLRTGRGQGVERSVRGGAGLFRLTNQMEHTLKNLASCYGSVHMKRKRKGGGERDRRGAAKAPAGANGYKRKKEEEEEVRGEEGDGEGDGEGVVEEENSEREARKRWLASELRLIKNLRSVQRGLLR